MAATSSTLAQCHPVPEVSIYPLDDFYKKYNLSGRIGYGYHNTVHRVIDVATNTLSEDVVARVNNTKPFKNPLLNASKDLKNVGGVCLCTEVYAGPNSDGMIGILPWAKGGDLYDFRIKNGPLTEKQAQCVIYQLAIIHKDISLHGVHRDLKLENVLLTAPGVVEHGLLLCDFDFYLRNSQLPRITTIHGTVMYQAPEAAHTGLCSATAANRAAMYAMGVILRLLVQETLSQTLDDIYQKVSPALKMVLLGLLHHCKDTRWDVDGLLSSEWVQGGKQG